MNRFWVCLRPDFSCNLCAFSANKPGRLLSISVQFVHSRVKAVFFTGHCVIFSCVFMHIAGSIFILNIFMAQRPILGLDQPLGEPPQWVGPPQIDNRQSKIGNSLSADPSSTSAALRSGQWEPASGSSVHSIITRVKHKVGYIQQPIDQQKCQG
jgi:hypothetical protein